MTFFEYAISKPQTGFGVLLGYQTGFSPVSTLEIPIITYVQH
mgnify:CR=1 FL=1